MKIKINGSVIAASSDYADFKGKDFKTAKAQLLKDGFDEVEYGDDKDGNGWAVYRKGNKEVELTYEWIRNNKKHSFSHAGKVLDVYVDEDINTWAYADEAKKYADKNVKSACGGRNAVKSAQTVWAASSNDYIYVIMNNGDPVAKGTYDAMTKKSLTYNYPVTIKKFPKAKLNSLMKMAKEARRPDPLKFAVNRYINDYPDEYRAINSSVKASIKSSDAIMAGPGAGYTIKWNLESINNINSFNVTNVSEPDEYGFITVEADCDVDVTVEIVEAYSYYYGIDRPINDVAAKMTKVSFEIDPDQWPELGSFYDAGVDFAAEFLNNEIYDIISNGEVMYGGGWSHSTWDGTLTDYDHDDLIEVKVTDEEVIQYVDDAVSGAFESDYDDTEDFDLEEY